MQQQQILSPSWNRFDHLGEGSAPVLVGLGCTLLLLGTQTVGFRFWARKRTNARLETDDWLSLVSWVCI